MDDGTESNASATLPYTTTRLPEPTLVATAGERKSGTHWDDPKQEGEKQGDITTTTLGSTTSSSSSFQTSSVVVGVSLSFLQDQLAQINADTSLTTADVVYQKIIPMLKTLPNKKLTYVMGTHPPYPDNPGNFGRATVFVSHAWRCSFGKLVTALERREQDVQVSEFYWLDIFSKDQFVINSETLLLLLLFLLAKKFEHPFFLFFLWWFDTFTAVAVVAAAAAARCRFFTEKTGY